MIRRHDNSHLEQWAKRVFHSLPVLILAIACSVVLMGVEDIHARVVILQDTTSCTDTCHTALAADVHVSPTGAPQNAHQDETANPCDTCHRMTEPGKHQFSFTATGGALCTGCHDDLTRGSHIHVPTGAGLCTTCHLVHADPETGYLKFKAESLCKTCHVNIARPGAHSSHLPVEQGQCVRCHDPHSSNHDEQLKLPIPELCFQCHAEEQQDRHGNPIPAIRALYDNSSLNKHPSFARGQCTLCHQPHASDNYRLQKHSYPDSIYAGFTTDTYFCVQCHGSRMFTEPRTLSETNFRNGNLNLHYRHVNRDKGRSCRACHHHHASDRPALITHTAPFGNRYIEISDYQQTETGGSCSPSCHQTMKYDRLSPVVNRFLVTEREGTDATPEELLLKPVPPDGRAIYEKRCQGCHGSNAAGRVGPNIQGATVARIDAGLDNSPMMWILRSLKSNEISSVAEYLQSNAITRSKATEATGETLFATICAGCHGVDGKGDVGPDIRGVGLDQIKQAIQSVTIMSALQALTEEELQAISTSIPSAMPAETTSTQVAGTLDGNLLFTTRCSGCHGPDASGGLGGLAPNISSASVALINDALGRVAMMKPLASLTADEIEAIARALPGNKETRTPNAAPARSEPETATPEDIAQGQELYTARCAACHAPDGSGLVGPAIRGTSLPQVTDAVARVPMMQIVKDLTNDELQVIVAFLNQ